MSASYGDSLSVSVVVETGVTVRGNGGLLTIFIVTGGARSMAWRASMKNKFGL